MACLLPFPRIFAHERSRLGTCAKLVFFAFRGLDRLPGLLLSAMVPYLAVNQIVEQVFDWSYCITGRSQPEKELDLALLSFGAAFDVISVQAGQITGKAADKALLLHHFFLQTHLFIEDRAKGERMRFQNIIRTQLVNIVCSGSAEMQGGQP